MLIAYPVLEPILREKSALENADGETAIAKIDADVVQRVSRRVVWSEFCIQRDRLSDHYSARKLNSIRHQVFLS